LIGPEVVVGELDGTLPPDEVGEVGAGIDCRGADTFQVFVCDDVDEVATTEVTSPLAFVATLAIV
jgi:hypothetical protein